MCTRDNSGCCIAAAGYGGYYSPQRLTQRENLSDYIPGTGFATAYCSDHRRHYFLIMAGRGDFIRLSGNLSMFYRQLSFR